MGEEMVAFYRIKRQRYNDRIYYYLYKEWYDPKQRGSAQS